MLHTTSSSACVEVNGENIVPKEIKLLDIKLETLEGTVISIDMSSVTVKHLCTKCSTFVEIDSDFYCCLSCNRMGSMESVTTSKPKI